MKKYNVYKPQPKPDLHPRLRYLLLELLDALLVRFLLRPEELDRVLDSLVCLFDLSF